MTDIAGLASKMREYFQLTVDQARGTYLGEDNRRIANSKRQIASVAGLCKHLDISKQDLLLMDTGSPEEKKFYTDYLLEYELAVDAMYAASMIDAKEYGELKKQFRASGAAGENVLTVILSKYNNPDDWEDYEDIKRFATEHEYSIRQIKRLLENADKAGLKP
ncbi:MAG: hypothetical protein WC374_04645 [Phycisphaerae bacterium]|jgi:hypothetical protein